MNHDHLMYRYEVLVRAEYARGAGVPCLMAIAQDTSGNAHDLTLS